MKPSTDRVKLNSLDRLVGWFSPAAGAQRAYMRSVLSRYEGVQPSRTRKVSRDQSTGTQLVQRDGAAIRAQARYLERNHDLARGALNVLVRNVVGPNGIGIDPTPRTANDDIHDQFARDLLHLWRDWTKKPEVTQTLDWAGTQQLACRTWLRDGEVFAQVLEGAVPLLDHGTTVPLSIELLEPQFVPLDYGNEERRIQAGIETNAWNRPIAYHVYKRDPAEGFVGTSDTDKKRVPASRMLHLALRDRINQLRGVSVLASSLGRIDDLKDYEESERIAARTAANIAAFVKRGAGSEYVPPSTDTPHEPRNLRLKAGAILDELAPGEELVLLDPKRPNSGLVGFRAGQLRAWAAGSDVSYSSISRDYDGTYSAQRQELVEQQGAYALMSNLFIAAFVRPIWERFVDMAIASRAIALPLDVKVETVRHADFLPPPMAWIDPRKEVEALKLQVRAGFRSASSVIRERTGNLVDTYEQLKRERDLAKELGLVLDSDAATPEGASPANAVDPSEPPSPRQLNGTSDRISH